MGPWTISAIGLVLILILEDGGGILKAVLKRCLKLTTLSKDDFQKERFKNAPQKNSDLKTHNLSKKDF